MGQKVNPHGLRVGVIKDWDSRWFTSKREFGDTLVEDYKIRKVLKKQLYNAGVPKIEIERTIDNATSQAPHPRYHPLREAGAWSSAVRALRRRRSRLSSPR